MDRRDTPAVIPRTIPEGTVPLISVEGTAYECGRQYAEIVVEKYPGYRRYLNPAADLQSLSRDAQRLLEERAPHLPDLHRGILDVAGPPRAPDPDEDEPYCTSFGVSGAVTLDGRPISGQTKDTPIRSAELYIVLRMRIKDAPAILVLAYPGEVLGYGMWSTGMTIFRNSLHSAALAEAGLPKMLFGFLALAGKSVHDAVELAKRFGVVGAGNFLLTDSRGDALSIEWNAGGVAVAPAQDGIATHTNHPEGEATKPFEDYPDEGEKENSRYRMRTLWQLLDAERGRLTAQRAMMLFADHSGYPIGI